MKFFSSALVALVATAFQVHAFVPSPSFTKTVRTGNGLSAVDPSMFHDLPHHIDSMQNAFSSLMLSDEEISTAATAVADVANSAASVAADTAAAVADTAAAVPDAAAVDNGWFGFLAGPIESIIQLLHNVLVAVGLDSNAWGVSIIALTLLIKLVTYPLSKTQIEGTTKMQMLQPAIKEIQTKYASNTEVMNQKLTEFYSTNDINPLAGCGPAIVQLPVFIGLYRAVLSLARENKLNEPFLWLPSLEGPTYGADPASATSWLLSGWQNGTPSLGWEDTIAFLTLPVFLVLSTAVSQKLSLPKNPTPEQKAQQDNIVLKLLPLLLGWFSISVPSALGVYWVTNNIVTTLLTLQIKSSLESNPPVVATGGGTTSSSVMDTRATFTPAPIRDKPAGFASSATDFSDDITPITPMDAEIVDSEDFDAGEVPRAPGSPSKKKKKKRKKN